MPTSPQSDELSLRHARLPGTARLFARAVRLRCPNCGRGKLFESWFRMHDHCPICRLKTLFLAFDLVFRPAARDELTASVDPSSRPR